MIQNIMRELYPVKFEQDYGAVELIKHTFDRWTKLVTKQIK